MERVKEVRTCFMNYHLIWIELKNDGNRLSIMSVLKCLIVSLMINQAFFKGSGGKSCSEETGRLTIR